VADHFEEAKDEILRRTAGNGGPSTVDILTALGALAKDVDEAVSALDQKQHDRHKDTIGEVREICARVGRMENWRADVEVSCPLEIEAAIERGVEEAVERSCSKHDMKHEAFVEQLEERFSQKRRSEDPLDDDWTSKRTTVATEADKQIWLMWMVGSKLGYILLAVLIAVATWTVRWAITGTP
jgi:hypothetical protein